MGELKPLLEMHQGADDRIKGEIRRALEGLGDVRDNLWPMESRANQHMKGARSWHHVSFEEAADFGYTPDDVRSMRREEDRMRREIKARIEQLVRHFESQLAGAPAGPPPPPRALPPLPPLPDV
jgi:predicted phosphohydrolase